ncbi:hypothetical protein IMZ16_01085 [Cruoricaptor ignavus]|uniref:Uncharacterized protein n=1 Tax=Cruoricaptor ignavus TaxID=1118202 RepID=A0A7M1T5B9_9FLAO|nr:hypothetical protein [Cruoricaptor ignavus]QOR74072.1 hypothetical protein IMZ16_01085 [Cruoricaptor ignavus]
MKTLSKITLAAAVVLSAGASAQVIIGDAVGTATNKTSVLLDFANTNNKGIILPYVRIKNDANTPTKPTEGMIILDATDATKARVKYYNGVTSASNTSGWVDLSGQDGNLGSLLDSQPNISEATEAKTIIGAATTAVNDGVLVLESATKAMVLPQVDDVNNIPTPSPGMMVFVRKEGFERLAVFNGTKWSFWKP